MTTSKSKKQFLAGSVLTTAVLSLLALPVAAKGPEAHNMRLVGMNDLQGRSAYQPIIQKQGDRWIAYIGHHNGSALNPLTGIVETNGVSIVDVTNPRHPVYLHHIPGAAGAQMVRACSGDDLPLGVPGHTYLLRSDGNVAHYVHDVTNPSNPSAGVLVSGGLNGTHKNYWECTTGIAYLVSGVPGWNVTRVTQIFDLSDPMHPDFIRNFGLDGQQPGATVPADPQGPHGCISVIDKNRVYCGHGTSSNGILVILDRNELLNPTIPLGDRANPTPAELAAPLVSRLNTAPFMGAHTTFPVLGVAVKRFEKDAALTVRDFIVLVNEAGGNECSGATRQMMFMVDITDDTKPWPIANFDVRETDGNFCSRGGRFGAHASNESRDRFYKKTVFISWFNAGVRAVDIRDPFSPKEVGYFIPRTTATTFPTGGKIAIQTNNVEVDGRGLIYTADRAGTGLHILKLTSKGKHDDDDDDDDRGKHHDDDDDD